MGILRKLGEGDRGWADRVAAKASKLGFVASIKSRPNGSFGNKLYAVYVRQNKKAKVHDYMGLNNLVG